MYKRKKNWELFSICLLNSTANPAQFWWKWAGLAVLFSRQLLNSSHNIFHISTLKKYILKFWKKSWVPFGRYLLNSTANPAHFDSNWAESAVLLSRYLPNGTHDYFQIFRVCLFKDFIKNPQTTIALTFLTHIISGIDGVNKLEWF